MLLKIDAGRKIELSPPVWFRNSLDEKSHPVSFPDGDKTMRTKKNHEEKITIASYLNYLC